MRTKRDREAARKLEPKATPGPWREHYDYKDGRPNGTMIGAVAPGHKILTDHDGGTYPSSDLAFLSAARTHWPAAEAELEEAAGLLRDIKETQTKLRPSLRKRLDTFLSTYDGGDDGK